MKVHISLNVKDIAKSVEFYNKMLGAEPVKYIPGKDGDHGQDSNGLKAAKTGYAKFDIANPPLNLALNEVDFSSGGSLSHLGLQVNDTDDVLRFRQNWIDKGLITFDEMGVDCCYAKQDKTWVADPDGNEWEAFVVLEDLDHSGISAGCDCSDKVSGYVSEKDAEFDVGCCGSGAAVLDTEEAEAEICCS